MLCNGRVGSLLSLRVFTLCGMVWLLAGAVHSTAWGRVVYVDSANVEAAVKDGTSWETAFSQLEDALENLQDNDEVWLALGTYTPGDETPYYHLGSLTGVGILGGFVGTESSPNERKPHKVSVLSADIEGDDAIVEGKPENIGDNRQGLFLLYDAHEIHIENLVLKKVRAAGPIYGYNCRARFLRCTIEDNFGANLATFSNFDTLMFDQCTFERNLGDGYAVVELENLSSMKGVAEFVRCRFSDNTGLAPVLAGKNVRLSVFHSLFNNNEGEKAGAIVSSEAESYITNCVFFNNYGEAYSGAIYHYDPSGEHAVENCSFYRNTSGGWEERSAAIVYAKATAGNKIIVRNSFAFENYGSDDQSILCTDCGDDLSLESNWFQELHPSVSPQLITSDKKIKWENSFGTESDELNIHKRSPLLDAGVSMEANLHPTFP